MGAPNHPASVDLNYLPLHGGDGSAPVSPYALGQSKPDAVGVRRENQMRDAREGRGMTPTSAEQEGAIAEIKRLGGTVAIEEKSPGKRVTSVELWNSKVTDARLGCLNALTNLTSLGLGDTKVSDAGLEHLKGLTSLQSLDLRGTKIGDAGLEHLKGLAQLRSLGPQRHQGERCRTGTPQRTDRTPIAGPQRHQGRRCRTGTPQRIDPTQVASARRHQG